MRIPRTLLIGALALCAAPAAIAQGQGPGPGGFSQRHVQRALQGITLSAAQQAQVDSITKSYEARMPAFTPGVRPDSATRARMFGLIQQQDADVRAVLTADQQKIFDANLAQMRARYPRRPGGR